MLGDVTNGSAEFGLMTKCTCWESRQKDYSERQTKVYADIENRVANMSDDELRSELIALVKGRVSILAFPCWCNEEMVS